MMSAAFAWMDRQCFLGGPSGAAHLHSGDHPVFGRFCSPAFCFRWTDFNTLRDRHAWGLPFCDTLSRNGGRPRTCLGLPVSFFVWMPDTYRVSVFARDGMGAPLGYWLGLQDASDCVVQNSVGYGPLSFPCRCRVAVCGASKERDGCDDT